MRSERSLAHQNAKREHMLIDALLCAVLCITTGASLLLGHARMMWADELLSFWGDRLPTAPDVLRVQLHYPISLDPPTYHLLAHWSMQVFGQGAMGMRFPALAGVVLAQVALFFFVRRIAGQRAAVIAAALPAALGPFWYSAEGRPYGWLLGMYGLAMLCWHVAAFGSGAEVEVRVRIGEQQIPFGNDNKKSACTWALIGLALAIAGAITSHYFGVLILLPLAAGEMARTAERRRVDGAVVAAMVVGAASIGLILPFQHALKVYQQHYYNRHVTLEAIKLGYTNVISQSFAATCLFVLVVAVAGYLRFRRRTEPAATWALLLTLALLPVWCFLFELFVTHSMEGRYAVPAVIAFVAVLATVLEPLLRRGPVFYAVLGLVVLAGVASIAVKIRRERRFANEFYGTAGLPADIAADLARDPQQMVYINSFGDFLQDQYYAPPELQGRLSYVYDAGKDVRWLGRDTHSISAVNVRQYAPLHVTPYSEFLQQNKPLLLVYDVKDWEWAPRELASQHMPVTPLGTLLLGKLEQVGTHPSGMAAATSAR